MVLKYSLVNIAVMVVKKKLNPYAFHSSLFSSSYSGSINFVWTNHINLHE